MRKSRCGECIACIARNCGSCVACLDMRMYGGRGKMKKACSERKCMGIIKSANKVQKKRGRPRKTLLAERKSANKVQKKRGRPRKTLQAISSESDTVSTSMKVSKRGRSAKQVISAGSSTASLSMRKRGRPRKKLKTANDMTSETSGEVDESTERIDIDLAAAGQGDQLLKDLDKQSSELPYQESQAAELPSQEIQAAELPYQETQAATDPSQETQAATDPSQETQAATDPSQDSQAATDPSQESHPRIHANMESLEQPTNGIEESVHNLQDIQAEVEIGGTACPNITPDPNNTAQPPGPSNSTSSAGSSCETTGTDEHSQGNISVNTGDIIINNTYGTTKIEGVNITGLRNAAEVVHLVAGLKKALQDD